MRSSTNILSKSVASLGGLLGSIFRLITGLIRRFFKLIVIIIVISVLISWISVILASLFASSFITSIAPDPSFSGYIGYYAGVISLLILPTLFIVSSIVRRVWGYHSPVRFSKALHGLWIVCFVLFGATALFTARCFSEEYNGSELVKSVVPASKIYKLGALGSTKRDNSVGVHFGHMVFEKTRFVHFRGAKVLIEPSPDEEVHLIRQTCSRGTDRNEAQRNVKMMRHNFEFDENAFNLESSYFIDAKDKFRVQELQYTLQLPLSTELDIDLPNQNLNWSSFKKVGDSNLKERYVMTPEGLSPLNDKTDASVEE